MVVDVQRHALADLLAGKLLGTHRTGGWVGLEANLDERGKSFPYRDSKTEPSIS
jgi:hypothetical protein